MTFLEVSIACVFIFGGLWYDLKSHSDEHTIGVKEAAKWTGFWIGLSMVFAMVVYWLRDLESAQLFITGYVLEKSLAVDNLFVFMMIFYSFGLSKPEQSGIRHQILYWGIIGAILLRVVFIGLGSYLANLHPGVMIAFGVIILVTAWMIWNDNGDEEEVDYTTHWATKIVCKVWEVAPTIGSGKFFIKKSAPLNGYRAGASEASSRWMVTPLFLCLVVIEVSDIMFAFDSVPTIIAVAKDPYIIYTASIFAVMGLRSMYFLLDAAKDLLVHLETAIVAVLVFVGLKIIVEGADIYHISTLGSLGVVMTLLCAGIIGSLVFPEKLEASD